MDKMWWNVITLKIAHVWYIKIAWNWHDFEALGLKLQIFHYSIDSQFPEEVWAQRKPNQISKNGQ